MAKKIPPTEAPTEAPADTVLSFGQQITETLRQATAMRIRQARSRTPAPTYEQIAVEVGCCVKTVWNVLNGRTHA